HFAIFQGVGTGHHVDCVYEELSRNARFFLVLAETEYAQARDNNDRRIGIAQLWRIARSPIVVIPGVRLPIVLDLRPHALLQDLNILMLCIPGQEPGTNPCSEEVVRTTRA